MKRFKEFFVNLYQRLCSHSEYDWFKADTYKKGDTNEIITEVSYKCARCGKIIRPN
jgi:hypothetical protein